MNSLGLLAVLATLMAPATLGQGGQQVPPKPAPQTAPAKPVDPQTPPRIEETVVVTASKTETTLINAPATMTVITAKQLENAPSQNYADILRQVPGVNVTQLSARDINLTSRAATSSLSTSQLALVDGRSLYQDFFGFIMWDFMPVNTAEIKQIEVIRGPASAVWGANAVDGVINVITKSPREMQGTTASFGFGGFARAAGADSSKGHALFSANGSYSAAANDRWAYKLSAGITTSDPLSRPTGAIPGGTGTYPAFTNSGTNQPKFDARADYDAPNGGRVSISGGVAGTSGIMESGIGPFDIQKGSVQGYGKVNYTKRAFKFQSFLNTLNGDATQLLTVDVNGKPIAFSFKTTTFDAEVGNATPIGTKQVVTYGGNIRHNTFTMSIAPGAKPRTEGGAYIQDEIFATNQVRFVIGGRVDKFTSIDNAVFSPRASVIFKPRPDQSIRVSYNRAYRAPSAINNFLNLTIAEPIAMKAINANYGSTVYLLPVVASGNATLKQETLDSFEVGYTGSIKHRATVSIAVYYNKLKDEILFTQVGVYGATPPAGFPGFGPVPGAAVWAGLVAAGANKNFPSEFSYRNLGKQKDKGIEIGIDGNVGRFMNASLDVYANYAFQALPVVDFDIAETNHPSKHKFNAGVSYADPRCTASLTVSYSGQAFWQDVLDTPYHGTTAAYTMVNASFGMKFDRGRYTASIKVNNLTNQNIQQHIFGDIMKMSVVGELRVQLPK